MNSGESKLPKSTYTTLFWAPNGSLVTLIDRINVFFDYNGSSLADNYNHYHHCNLILLGMFGLLIRMVETSSPMLTEMYAGEGCSGL